MSAQPGDELLERNNSKSTYAGVGRHARPGPGRQWRVNTPSDSTKSILPKGAVNAFGTALEAARMRALWIAARDRAAGSAPDVRSPSLSPASLSYRSLVTAAETDVRAVE